MDTLTLFNQQILQCQDDAYTLAWYLLGDEAQAEAVMQAAAERAYHCFSARRANCRLQILGQVVDQCRGRVPSGSGPEEAGVFAGLRSLAEPERAALVLVDVLGLSYGDAAWVMGRSLKETGRLLAQARRKIMSEKEFTKA